jgi:hypothetical protein
LLFFSKNKNWGKYKKRKSSPIFNSDSQSQVKPKVKIADKNFSGVFCRSSSREFAQKIQTTQTLH